MSKGWIADVVGQAGRLHDLPEVERRKALRQIPAPGRQPPDQNAQRAPHAAHFQRMGQPVVDMIIPAQGMHLRFFGHPAEGTGKYDPVVILKEGISLIRQITAEGSGARSPIRRKQFPPLFRI